METSITITRTGDVPDDVINLISDAAESVGIAARSELHGSKGGETPVYIQILADLITWKMVLGISATAFLTKFAQKAGEDAYDVSKAVTQYLATQVARKLRAIATAVFKASQAAPAQTSIAVGFPIPNTFFSTAWQFRATSEEDVAINMAIFALKAEAINEALETVVMKTGGPGTGVFLEVNADGSVVLRWHNSETLELREFTVR
jgi:uncharacterized protein YodC (DUF2158 family)